MPSQNPPSGRPEIPPDIPPEFVDAYLAGFQRGYGGEVDPVTPAPVDDREPAGLAEHDRPRDDFDPPTGELDQATDESDQEGLDRLDRPEEALDRPGETSDRPGEASDRPGETSKRPVERADAPIEVTDRPGRKAPNTDRPEDMEWLFERDRDAPLGWAFDPADENAKNDESRSKATSAGSTSTATEASAGRNGVETGRSPWVVLIGFLAILAVLMLVAYIGGMAFSTIVSR